VHIAQSAIEGVVDDRFTQQILSPTAGDESLFEREVIWSNEVQVRESKVHHRPRNRANIKAVLRLDEDDVSEVGRWYYWEHASTLSHRWW
jgi:hypothetical protein